MNLSGLCMNCMNGTLVNGSCTYCGKNSFTEKSRNANALPFGCTLHNQYFIGRVLGAGGFGITYLAWDNNSKKRVALKELFPCKDVYRSSDGFSLCIVPGQEEYFRHVKQRFLDEARLLAGLLDYKEIIDVYHLFPDNNTAYYAMEFIEGEDLRSFAARNGKMQWAQLQPIVRDVLVQLSILHQRGLVHRDISPDNIYLLRSGGAKLIDFGSSRMYTGNGRLTTFLKDCYAPLEQYRENGNQGPWTDIYSLSVTIYYLLSGVLPCKSHERVSRDPVIPLCRLDSSIPKWFSDAIEKGMAVHTSDRYSNAAAFMSALGIGMGQNRQQAGNTFVISCIGGHFHGKTWPLNKNRLVSIGRNTDRVITYPLNYPGVSRRQCSLTLDINGMPCIKDDGSSYGTFINGNKAAPEVWLTLHPGSMITFGKEKFTIQSI